MVAKVVPVDTEKVKVYFENRAKYPHLGSGDYAIVVDVTHRIMEFLDIERSLLAGYGQNIRLLPNCDDKLVQVIPCAGLAKSIIDQLINALRSRNLQFFHIPAVFHNGNQEIPFEDFQIPMPAQKLVDLGAAGWQ